MLGWLAAAAAPLLIHLWSRHRFRESPWAAMQFLLAAMRKNARRLQFQQWLLLAVRTLIILLVVLAVAEPYGERLLAGDNAAPVHRVLVIDASYSMAYRPNGNTNFAQAKRMAADMVRSSHPGDVFTVILMSSAPKLAIDAEVFDHAAAARQIESLAQTHAGADLVGTMILVQEALAKKDGRRVPARKEVYFFTDLQRRTWGGLAKNDSPRAETKESDIATAVGSIAKIASLVVVDLGQAKAQNLAVTNFSSPEAAITVGREIEFDATIHNFGNETHKQNAELLVDGEPVGEQTLDISGGSDAAVHFAHRFSSAGTHTLTVRASGDRLDVDNTRSLVVPVRTEIRVLCVAGREGAARYLAKALNPSPAGNSAVRPVIVAEGDLAETELADFDCVFLCNVAQVTAGEAKRLARFAATGGGVVFFLGDRVVPESYNALGPQTEQQNGHQLLLPARIGDLVAQSQFGLDPLKYRHPIVAPFRGRERAGLLTTPVNRFYRLDIPTKQAGAEVAVATPSGDPFIVTAPFGRGRTVLVATDGSLASVDPASGEPWTTWPTWPSFLPIVREMLAYASGGQQTRWQQFVGTPLIGVIDDGISSGAAADELKITRPDGHKAGVASQSTSNGSGWSYADTDESGIYSLTGLPKGCTQQFAVNVDTAEGDLAKVDVHQLPAQLKVRATWQGEENAPTTVAISQSSLNQQILWGALALLFIESLMAWQFGRGAI